jgi:hypothetical protein
MLIDKNKLVTISNFAKMKGITRQHAYRLILSKEITEVKIDDVTFIYLDDKALTFERKRKIKKNK